MWLFSAPPPRPCQVEALTGPSVLQLQRVIVGEPRLSSSSLIIKVSARAIRARGAGRASKKVSQSPGMRGKEARRREGSTS